MSLNPERCHTFLINTSSSSPDIGSSHHYHVIISPYDSKKASFGKPHKYETSLALPPGSSMTLLNITTTSSLLCPCGASGDISPRSTQRACVCSLLRRSPHCPVYRNSVILLVTEHTPNSQRQPTLPASKPSQQLTSRKTALSTQNNTKVALSKPREVEVNISTIDSCWQHHIIVTVFDGNTMVLSSKQTH